MKNLTKTQKEEKENLETLKNLYRMYDVDFARAFFNTTLGKLNKYNFTALINTF